MVVTGADLAWVSSDEVDIPVGFFALQPGAMWYYLVFGNEYRPCNVQGCFAMIPQHHVLLRACAFLVKGAGGAISSVETKRHRAENFVHALWERHFGEVVLSSGAGPFARTGSQLLKR